MRPLAIIPAFNEAPRIAAVVAGLRARALPVLVVDDGSRDATAAAAAAAGAQVLVQDNLGKGGAILAGCRWAVARGHTRVLLCDGDGQHDPASAWALIAAAVRCDLVIGTRSIGCWRQPTHRRIANRIASLLVTFVGGQAIRDSQSGLRVCDPRQLLALRLACRRYDLESEWCVRAARAGQRIREVAVEVIYGDKRSGMHPVRDTGRFLAALAHGWIRARLPGPARG